MADDLELYFFECGSLETQVRLIEMDQGLGAALVTGHDPEGWPKFEKAAPEYYS